VKTTLKDTLQAYSMALALEILSANNKGKLYQIDGNKDDLQDNINKVIDRVLGEYLGEK